MSAGSRGSLIVKVLTIKILERMSVFEVRESAGWDGRHAVLTRAVHSPGELLLFEAPLAVIKPDFSFDGAFPSSGDEVGSGDAWSVVGHRACVHTECSQQEHAVAGALGLNHPVMCVGLSSTGFPSFFRLTSLRQRAPSLFAGARQRVATDA